MARHVCAACISQQMPSWNFLQFCFLPSSRPFPSFSLFLFLAPLYITSLLTSLDYSSLSFVSISHTWRPPLRQQAAPTPPHHAIYRHSKTSYFAVCGLYSSKRLSCCQGMSASLYLSHALSPAMFCLILMSRDWAMTYELT